MTQEELNADIVTDGHAQIRGFESDEVAACDVVHIQAEIRKAHFDAALADDAEASELVAWLHSLIQ